MLRWFAATAFVLASVTACAPVSRTDVVRMENQIESLLELPTCEHIYRDLVYFGQEKSFLFIKTVDRAVLFSIDIRVRAGLDLAGGIVLTPDRFDSHRIYVRLPAAEVLTVDADESTIEQYFIREQGGRIGLMDLSGQIADVKARTRQEAVDRGILDQADATARSLVRGFLELAGFTDVVFSTTPATADEGLRG